MSEYQYVAFQAVDRPLTDKQLAFAERQSTRAEVSRWSFNVEYHYSTFRGSVDGLLRGGYDVYLTYFNYGLREIKLRLPHGLPFSKKTWSPLVDGERLSWQKDRKGKGGILSICPYLEEEFDQIWDFGRYLDVAVHVRELLIGGDLRALYLLWLCVAADDSEDHTEVIEPPVPHGLGKMPDRGSELLAFFGIDPLLLKAAATGIPSTNTASSTDGAVSRWVKSLSATEAKRIVQRVLTGDVTAVKSDLLATVHDAKADVDWPCEAGCRTVAELLELCESVRRDEDTRQKRKSEAKARREAAKAAKQRQARMKEMVAAPQAWLGKVDELVSERGTDNYRAAADILADLREAIGAGEGDKITRRHAAHLAKKYPTLNVLKSSLRKRGLLD